MTSHSHKGGTNATKDVIYIDVDDEITGIIEKVRSSQKKIVALVLPKRASVLQSIVNMKLLKRAATESKKNLVLITAEAGLLPLAGNVGLHVAKSLNTKPEVPEAPASAPAKAEAVEAVDEAGEAELDPSRTVGELSGEPEPDEDETIELDDEEAPEEAAGGMAKKVKNKKFRIPNFNKFRVLLLLAGVGVILLGAVGYAAFAVWPAAKITIKTDSTAADSNILLALKTGEDVKLDVEKSTLKAGSQEVKKTLTETVPATGQKNTGEKATGEVTITNCTGEYLAIPAGTGLSSRGQAFVTDEKLELTPSPPGCLSYPNFNSKSVGITAVSSGTKSNISAGDFTVSGYANRTKASSSAATTGGTDEVLKVVSKQDVESAEQKIAEQDDEAVKQELKSALMELELFVIEETFSAGKPKTKLSAAVNEEAESVTVTQTITYTMLGVTLEDLEKILAKSVEDKIDTKKQKITDYGLDQAAFSLQGTSADGTTVAVQATVVAGAELDKGAIKKQVAGKKAGDAKSLISANVGVTDVDVEYSPFWVSSIPKRTDKITIVIQEPQVTKDGQSSSP